MRFQTTRQRMKSGAKDWLFIKERDEFASDSLGTSDYPMNSVFTGLSLEDLACLWIVVPARGPARVLG